MIKVDEGIGSGIKTRWVIIGYPDRTPICNIDTGARYSFDTKEDAQKFIDDNFNWLHKRYGTQLMPDPVVSYNVYHESDERINNYLVTISFGGYIGSDNEYRVSGSNEEEATEYALNDAADDLYIEGTDYIGDGEYEVTISYAGFIGVENTYSEYADSEEEAEELAMIDARDDLEAGDIEII